MEVLWNHFTLQEVFVRETSSLPIFLFSVWKFLELWLMRNVMKSCGILLRHLKGVCLSLIFSSPTTLSSLRKLIGKIMWLWRRFLILSALYQVKKWVLLRPGSSFLLMFLLKIKQVFVKCWGLGLHQTWENTWGSLLSIPSPLKIMGSSLKSYKASW